MPIKCSPEQLLHKWSDIGNQGKVCTFKVMLLKVHYIFTVTYTLSRHSYFLIFQLQTLRLTKTVFYLQYFNHFNQLRYAIMTGQSCRTSDPNRKGKNVTLQLSMSLLYFKGYLMETCLILLIRLKVFFWAFKEALIYLLQNKFFVQDTLLIYRKLSFTVSSGFLTLSSIINQLRTNDSA